MLPLDGEKSFEFFEDDGGLVGEKTISEEETLQVESLLSVQIKVQFVILSSICQLIKLLLPLPANLHASSVRSAQTE